MKLYMFRQFLCSSSRVYSLSYMFEDSFEQDMYDIYQCRVCSE